MTCPSNLWKVLTYPLNSKLTKDKANSKGSECHARIAVKTCFKDRRGLQESKAELKV